MEEKKIKFRAWDTKAEYMVYDIAFTPRGTPKVWSDPMQYTGLKDKDGKGKEMYHKDLIINTSRNGGKPHPIEWSNKFGGWVGVYIGLEYLIAQELHEIEVVGNFYEGVNS